MKLRTLEISITDGASLNDFDVQEIQKLFSNFSVMIHDSNNNLNIQVEYDESERPILDTSVRIFENYISLSGREFYSYIRTGEIQDLDNEVTPEQSSQG